MSLPLPPGVEVRARRSIRGYSAVLLPFGPGGEPDWRGFESHLRRTRETGLTPAVNLDTGHVGRIGGAARTRVLDVAREGGGPFLAGAGVHDGPGAAFDPGGYAAEMERVEKVGGTPVVLPSHGLGALDPAAWVTAHRRLAEGSDAFFALEMGAMFVPCGRIYPLEAYRGLLGIPQCIGAGHASLRRAPEWERLLLRDRHRPEFMVLSGNELAIDMVMYGSDYLLGLSTFAPDLFARRDAFWRAGQPDFHELNDALQSLGAFAFRPPVPAHPHSAAQFLALRGWIDHDATHPGSPRRRDGDLEVLAGIAARLGL